MSTPVLEVRGLRYSYPDGTDVLRGVDLTIAKGESVAVLGPNGAGKTTLALHLNGILRASSGEVRVHGVVLDDATVADARRRVGMVFQDPDDQLFMTTVGQDVAFGPTNYGLRDDELDARVRGALSAVGMLAALDKAPHHLSLGERGRVAIATVLAMDPDVIVFDEPSSNLDPAARVELASTLRGLELSIVVVTHDLPYALELCERAVIIDGGRIVADAPTRSLLSDADLLAAHRLAIPAGFSIGST